MPQDESGTEEYQTFLPITEIFPVNVTGVQTSRDHFVLDIDHDALLRRINQFRDLHFGDDVIRSAYALKDTRGWKLPEKRRRISKLEAWRQFAVPCLYRPFDDRWLYYHPDMVDWPRSEVMRHMLAGENMGIAVGRAGQVIGSEEWNIAFCALHITELNLFRRGGNNLFPLYLYPDADRHDLFTHLESTGRRPNLNLHIIAALASAHGREPTPEEIFDYVYAVLYAPAYRERYAEFLRMDFPRIPFTADRDVFAALASLGSRLTALHLLKSPELDTPTARFAGAGDGLVAKSKGLHYDAGAQRVYINPTQYFAPVPAAAWQYQIGGYQVCQKWLKDRQERQLSLEEVRAYCRIVTALARTVEIQSEIDAFYPAAEAETISLPDK
jgi:predicted helicase